MARALRKGRVRVDGKFAGIIEEIPGAVRFTYSPAYLQRRDAKAVSLTLPLQSEPYVWNRLHPFFSNLLPEGFYLDIVSRKLKVAREDHFGLLIGTCGDCVGNVSVVAFRKTKASG
jgi:serine/threonine-protein kinase HipA